MAKRATNMTVVRGQRVFDTGSAAQFAQMAEEALNTSEFMMYSLCLAAVSVYETARVSERQKEWGTYNLSAMVTYWAGFLEGVRTQKQKQREKRQKKSRLATQTLNGRN